MSYGNTNDQSNKGNNSVWQRAQLKLLVAIRNAGLAGGAYTQSNQTITGTTMTLPQSPTFVYGIYLNGQKLTETTDYSITGNIITFVNVLAADLVSAVYTF